MTTLLCADLMAEIVRLRKGIQDYIDGDYGREQHFKTKHDKCPHGLYGWEACENCIDAHFTKLLFTPALTSKLVERCPSCGRDDDEYHARIFSCSNPWHGDDHLRRATPAVTSKEG